VLGGGPVTPPRGFAAVPEVFHPITLAMTSDATEVTCASCGLLEHTGTGPGEGHVAHGADHAIATGHTVTETRIRVTVITGHPA